MKRLLDRITSFLFYVKSAEGNLPLLDKIAVFTLYSITGALFFTSVYNLPFVLEKDLVLSSLFLIGYIALSVIGLSVFWSSRTLSAARIPFGAIVLLLMVQQFYEAGGIYGLGLLYLLLGFQVLFLLFGLRSSIFFMLTYFVGVTVSLLGGQFNRTTSIYNNPEIVGRMIFIVAFGTVLSILVSLCLQQVLRF